MKRTIGRLLTLGAVVLAASAHIGSPNTYFEGAAGSYPVRVIVRSPGVVPGLAQITVRLLAPSAVRESMLEPGAMPDRLGTWHARLAMAASALVFALLVVGARTWWHAVDAAYRTGLYRPPHASATVRFAGGAPALRLAIDDSSWVDRNRQWTPLIPDHGHLMHLFLIRDSSLDALAHLHPLPLDSTTFEARFPPLPAGRYRVYADIVHESGFAQTLTTTVDVGEPAGRAWRSSDPDDAFIDE